MKTACTWILRIGLAAALGLGARQGIAQEKASPQVARGQYLVTILGCNDCHTPLKMGPKGPEPDMTRMLSGHPQEMKLPPTAALAAPWMFTGTTTLTAFSGPWGVTYAANLTPDPTTGTGGGAWSEEVFMKALKTGKHFGTSRDIQPPMPWMWVGKASNADLKAIWAYLRTIPPVKNLVPDYEPPKTPPGK